MRTPTWQPFRTTAILALAAGAWAAALAAGCGPMMVERDGRRVFNPHYRVFLEGSRRDAWQNPDAVLTALELPPDAVVADVGAGGGYFTERFARHLDAGGAVLATDAQEDMVRALRRRVEERGLDNVTVLHTSFDDPGLPAGCCDLVFLSSVYKEMRDRVAWMRRLRGALRPGGRVAILEFLPGSPGPGPPEAMRLAPETITAEMTEAGYRRTASHDVVPRQSFLIFEAEPYPDED